MDITQAKKHLRTQIWQARAALPDDLRRLYSRQATEHLLACVPLAACQHMFAFYPYKDEIDTRFFIQEATKRGQHISLPLTIKAERRMIPYLYTAESNLRQGAYGIYEPDPELGQQVTLDKLEAVIVPGVAFDLAGGRMGYGGGYYDRFFTQIPAHALRIGYGFSLQVVAEVPREEHDVTLHYMVTEEGISQTAT